MKKLTTLFCLLLILSISVKAQFVTIPDTNFVAWLQNWYPACMNGNLMDTTCPGIQNATNVSVNYQHISDLTGIEYFVNLQDFQCIGNQLTVLPALPALIQNLRCYNNQLTVLPALPASLQHLY